MQWLGVKRGISGFKGPLNDTPVALGTASSSILLAKGEISLLLISDGLGPQASHHPLSSLNLASCSSLIAWPWW